MKNNTLSVLKPKIAVCISLVILLLFSVVAVAAPAAKLIPFWDDREVDSAMSVDHSKWQEILNHYLNDKHPSGINRFSYADVSVKDKKTVKQYLDYLQSIEPRQLNANEQKAYWINLYNAATVYVVLENNTQIKSILEIRSGIFSAGPWRRKFLKVAQQKLSLDDIEHGILRPIYQDMRLHYVLNCASLGCPNLLKTAFTARNVNELLDFAAIQFINHARAVEIRDNTLYLSEIYKWYAIDFGTDFNALLTHLGIYARAPLDGNIKKFKDAKYQYDWELNRP